MKPVNSEEWQRLRRLYETEGESAVQRRRDEIERQKGRVLKELTEATNKFLTALAAADSAQTLIEEYDDPEDPDALGNMYHFAVKGPPKHTQLEILDTGEIPDHVEDAIAAVEEDNEDECAPGYWRREETAVAAITGEEEIVFRVSDQKPPELLYERAEAERQQLRVEIGKRHEELERLQRELNQHEDFLSKALIGEIEEAVPDIFEGRPTLRSHAAEIVGKYRSDPSSLPKGRRAMGRFRENWVPDSIDEEGNVETGSSSKVNQIQRAIRKAGLSDEYSDPESFCDLVERLVERHDTAKS